MSLKTIGGMTRGRGMTELQRAVWLLSTPTCVDINESMQQFTGIVYETSEQHRSNTCQAAKILKMPKKLMEYVMARNPCSVESELINIHTGEVAGNTHKTTIPNYVNYVLDEGPLLFKVLWKKDMSYSDMFNLYITDVSKHYDEDDEGANIVFDGYGVGPSTRYYTPMLEYKGEIE